MAQPYKATTRELQRQLSVLGDRLSKGDESEVLVWVIPGNLACAHRPLRKHPIYGGSQVDLPVQTAPLVQAWVRRIKQEGIRSVVVLMGDKELRHYHLEDLGAAGLLDLYRREGLVVQHIPWEDPAHPDVSPGPSYEEQLEKSRSAALAAFDTLPTPLLIHCSAGIQRSSPVAAFVFVQRTRE